ncbi:outer membrane lipoprotein carrier protein LolA [Taibaiella lutea]|uniref:Outer membrane lipoprotein carrier protein LolA n=1 Tax=Taibaiella lutea TaxID=2608001 RepID=A0A5M6CI70_9BACT|nr:outer membrane lipoprotein carrier protein LolA [Taibaiella lutea]KAA5534706.1 outer membrane lipoprotein carrier protein LolA [Taibaiella lutea]
MKKLLSLLLVATTFISFQSQAQDAKAKVVLDKLSSKVKSMTSLKANFVFTMNDAKGASKGNKSGTFLMQGNKFRVNMTGQQIICDGRTLWTYLVSDKEVQVSNYDANSQSISPAKLFSGSYTKDYKYTYGGAKTVAGKSVDVIELTPVNGKSFKKILLYVDQKTSMVNGGIMYDKSGSSYGYTISGVTPNAKVAATDFTFDAKKNPGVEVIDLR